MARCDSYAFGNCTRGACEQADFIPEGLGDGGDWAADYAAQGGVVTMIPTAGSVVSYCRGDGYSEFGHCAYVLEVYPDGTFLVKERNYVAFNVDDERRSSGVDVCGFLLAPGMTPGQTHIPGRGAPGPASLAAFPAELVNAWETARWWTDAGHNLEWTRVSGTWQAIDGIPL